MDQTVKQYSRGNCIHSVDNIFTFYCFFIFLTGWLSILSSAQDRSVIIEENFNDNKNGWRIIAEQESQTQVGGGFFQWQHSAQGGAAIYNYLNTLDSKKDFRFETRIISKKIGSEYGVMIGGIDQENALFFAVKNLQYRIFEYKKNRQSILKDWTTSLSSRPDHNIFRVEKKGNRLFLYLNDKEVHIIEEVVLQGKAFGFAAWFNSSFHVDKLTVEGTKIPINHAKELHYATPGENLGQSINSASDELTPVITSDGKAIFFSRTYSPQNVGGATDYQDVYYSQYSNNQWTKAVNVGKPVNSHGPNAVSAVSADGNSILLMNTYDNKGETQSMGISLAHRISGGWSVPKTLPVKNFYNRSIYNEYHLSSDNKIILLALQRDDTYGTRDIYVSFLEKDGTWSVPKNLGPVVNTPGTELSPFLAADNVTLYFSSTGHPGYGKNDIFLTRRLDDSWTNWSSPENIGQPVNTAGLDAYYTIPASGEFAYYVSEKNSFGGSDIFRIRLPQAVKPKPVVVIYGKVLNSKSKEPIATGITYRDLETDEEYGIARSNPEDGNYRIVLPYDKAYSFFAEKDGFYSVRDSIDIPNITEYLEIERNIYLTSVEIGALVPLKNVFFVRSEATLLPSSYPELNKLVKMLEEQPTMEIELEGHTDNVGSAEKNVELSEQRVVKVKQYLVEKGISETRITGKGYGGSRPIADNSNEVTRRQNRRVEFKITKI